MNTHINYGKTIVHKTPNKKNDKKLQPGKLTIIEEERSVEKCSYDRGVTS